MALVKCPDCEKMVSSRVAACPNCGCPSEYFIDNSVGEYSVVQDNVSYNNINRFEKSEKMEISASLTKTDIDDIQFIFGDYVVAYPESTSNIAKIYGKYIKLFREYMSKYAGLYNSAGDMYTVLTSLVDQVFSDIRSLEEDAARDLYEFGISITRKEFDDKYVPSFKKNIESLYNQYASVEQEKDNLAYKRNVQKASRGRWQGGGFGMKGAIKGAMNAAVLNAGSDLFHSIGDGIARSGDRKYINDQFESLYVSESNRDEFICAIAHCCESVLEGIKIEMGKIGLIDINIFGDSDEISSVYETTIKYEKSSEKMFEKMLQCIRTSPEDTKFYRAIIPDLFQKDCELKEFLSFWNLDWIYEDLQEEYSKQLMENIENPFVTNLCSFCVKFMEVVQETDAGLHIYGKVLKGTVSVGDEVSIIKNLATPIINAKIIKIKDEMNEVNRTKLGECFSFVLNLKNKDSIQNGELIVNASSFKHPESNLYATYEVEGERVAFDFAAKYMLSEGAWYTFVKEDKYVSNREIGFANSFKEIMNVYGDTAINSFDKEKDALIEVAKFSNDIVRLNEAKAYIEYAFGKEYRIRFYFDANNELLLVAYLKNVGVVGEKQDSSAEYGFVTQIECAKCNKLISADKKFCNFCGEPSPLYMRECSSCGKIVKKEAKFCNFCGYDFDKVDSETETLEMRIICVEDDGIEYIIKFYSTYLEVVEREKNESDIQIKYRDIDGTECMEGGIAEGKPLPDLVYGFGDYLLRIDTNGEYIDIGFDTKENLEIALSFVSK